MIIKKMKIDDYDEIHQIWSNTNGTTLRAIDDSKEGIERFLKRNPNNNFICRIDGKIIGGILCGHDGRKGFIYHAVVKKNYRNRGIGKKLVENVIKSLKEENITKIGVLVNSDNISGNNFWKSLGFEYFDNLKYRILPLDEFNT
ncbi:GNAT family N-acetyltransferase [bacterium]|nr:GNAT family N-acetyltransferase [bacterium]